MKPLIITPSPNLHGQIHVPGDKSISHRSLLLGALAQGDSHIQGFLPGGDCLATLNCLQELGVKIDLHGADAVVVHGKGTHGLSGSQTHLNCIRSGTTLRLMTGLLAGQMFDSILTGEEQLLHRPMLRVTQPLCEMGADIQDSNGKAPLYIRGMPLVGHEHFLKVASAQVKSALILAGLYAEGKTIIHQPGPARDHTERMLRAMGANIETSGLTVAISRSNTLTPIDLVVPGDISSAAFPIIAGIISPGSKVTIERIGVNPTRTGLLDILMTMGARIEIENLPDQGDEPVANITVYSSQISGVNVYGDLVVRMIDEFPVFAVAATQAHGTTVLRDASELRVKETDRIATVVTELSAMGANIQALPDGFIIEGPTPLLGGAVSSHGDHRLAMALAIAGLVSKEETIVDDIECTFDSFPGFVQLMKVIGAKYD